MIPSQQLARRLKPIPTANGCVWEHWISYEICRFHARKTALAVVIDLLNCPIDVNWSYRCSLEHYHSICYSFLVWPFEKSFLINAVSLIHPLLLQANDKYYHRQTLKRVRRHQSIVERLTRIFRRINWQMVDGLTGLCSGRNVLD